MKEEEITALAEGLKTISAGLIEIADALAGAEGEHTAAEPAPAKDAAPSTAKPQTEEPSADPQISFEEVRGALAGKAAEGYRTEVKEILKKYNASCLSELEEHPELFPDILKDAEVIGNA